MWSPENPQGCIAMAVAESKLGTDLVKSKMDEVGRDVPLDAFGYTMATGHPRLRLAVKKMLEMTMMAGLTISADHIVASAGSAAILDNLFFCLGEQGDAVLVPAPYYPAFDRDLVARAGVVCWPVHLDKRLGSPSCQLSAALEAAEKAGRRVCGLLLTNPDNPTGELYAESQVQDMIRWCLLRGLHLVSNEVYGNSVFDANAPRFRSTAVLAQEDEGSDPVMAERGPSLVHVIYGMSKDWCMSGFRMGFLYTRNQRLLEVLGTVSEFPTISNHTQLAVASMLEDGNFVTSFLEENNRRMGAACEQVCARLDAMGVPYVRPSAGMFVWLDLSALLPGPSPRDADELALHSSLFKAQRLLLTPGQCAHGPKPGWFRMCYAYLGAGAIGPAMDRLEAFVRSMRRARE